MSITAIHTAALDAQDNRMIEAARTLAEFKMVRGAPLGGTGDADGADQYLRAAYGIAALLEVSLENRRWPGRYRHAPDFGAVAIGNPDPNNHGGILSRRARTARRKQAR